MTVAPDEVTDEEREILQSGKLAEELLAHRAWKAYEEGMSIVRANVQVRANGRGDTDFEKGTLEGLNLALRLPSDTLETRNELLRDFALRGMDEEGKPISQKKVSAP